MNLAFFAPTGQTFAAIVAVSFFVVLSLAAYVAFKALKKTVKMAIRLVIVMVILVIAVVGSISLWWFSSDGVQKLKPPANTRR
jgi:uncharacterized membrane protein